MTSNSVTRLASVASAFFALAIPLRSQAGGAIVTAHQLAITFKTVSQAQSSAGDDKPGKFTASTNDIFESCVGTPPTKTQGIYLFIDCADPNNNTIAAIDTQPMLTTLALLGSITFDLNSGVQTTKQLAITASTVPAQIALSCNGALTTADVFGIVNVKFAALASTICPDSLTVKIIGTGSNPVPGDFIIDNGSSFNAKKRAAGISTFPPPM